MCLTAVCLAAGVNAADDFGFGDSSSLKLSFSGLQNGGFTRARDRYNRTSDISASVPVYSTKNDTLITKYSISAAVTSQEEQLPLVPKAFLFYEARLSAGAVTVRNKTGEMNMFRLGAGVAEEQDSLSDAHPRLNFLWMASRRGRPGITYLYGLSYSYILGRGLLFPAFGFNWKIDEKQDMNFIVPILVRYNYKVSPVLKTSAYSSIFGNQFRFKNQGLYPGYSDTLYFHTVGFKLGTGAEYKLLPALTLGADIAAVLRRDIRIATDSDNDVMAEKTNGDIFFQASCRYNFGGIRN